MYPKFAKSELESQRVDKKLALLDFAKGLINSYLMQNMDEVRPLSRWCRKQSINIYYVVA